MASAKKHFVEHDVLLWTDGFWVNAATFRFTKEPLGYPRETLFRYNTILTQEELLLGYDYLFYSDADMRFVADVKPEDIFSRGLTATLHPGFIGTSGTPERRPESRAYVPVRAKNSYFAGGFIGGRLDCFLPMARDIAADVKLDEGRGITAIWHDESHLNRYLYDHPPSKILSPSFCYPEGYKGQWGWSPEQYPPKLVACNKGGVRS
jgi:histo-blood group ABO system transferase